MRGRADGARIVAGVAFAAGLYLLAFVFANSPYVLFVMTLTLCYAIPAMALNLLLGYTGLVSLGHMGFAGAGAYVTAFLMKKGLAPFPLSLAAGTLAAGLVGALVGAPCLRLRSHFFIIVTLAVGMMLFLLFNNLDWLTGGAAGLPGIPRPGPFGPGFAVIDPRRPAGFYSRRHHFSAGFHDPVRDRAFGLRPLARRHPPGQNSAASRGVDVFAHKLAIFTVSAALAELGGGLQVEFLRAAAPQSFGFLENVNLVLIVIVGGAGSLFGRCSARCCSLPCRNCCARPTRCACCCSERLFWCSLYLRLAAFGVSPRRRPESFDHANSRWPMPDILEVDGITKSFGGVRAVDGASFRLAGPGIYGLIGPNGAGKTTLFDVVCGRQFADSGTVRLAGTRIDRLRVHRRARLGVTRTFQECRVFEQETCLDNVLFAAQDKHLGREWLQALGRHRNARRAVLAEAEYLLELVGLRRLQNEPAGNLSYGQRRLLEIVSSLIARPRLLLLDEPASGSTRRCSTCCAISAARLRRAADRSSRRRAQHGIRHVACLPYPRDASGASARRRSAGRHSDKPARNRGVSRLRPMLEARGLEAGYGSGRRIVNGIDLHVDAGEIVVVIGQNGAGKSTLLKGIFNLAPFRRGEVILDGAPVTALSAPALLLAASLTCRKTAACFRN